MHRPLGPRHFSDSWHPRWVLYVERQHKSLSKTFLEERFVCESHTGSSLLSPRPRFLKTAMTRHF